MTYQDEMKMGQPVSRTNVYPIIKWTKKLRLVPKMGRNVNMSDTRKMKKKKKTEKFYWFNGKWKRKQSISRYHVHLPSLIQYIPSPDIYILQWPSNCCVCVYHLICMCTSPQPISHYERQIVLLRDLPEWMYNKKLADEKENGTYKVK